MDKKLKKATKNKFPTYEFKVVDLTHPSIDVEATLNNFGNLGYKLVMKYTKNENENTYLILQKETT